MNMKFWNKDRAEDVTQLVQNGEASATIEAGTPVSYTMNGTGDGLSVVLPSSSTAAKVSTLGAGIATKSLAPGAVGPIQVYGFNRNTRIYRGSRAATTDSWPTFAAIAIGDILTINTVVNAMERTGAGSNSYFQPVAVAAEVIASTATVASDAYAGNYSSATAYYLPLKTFLRFM